MNEPRSWGRRWITSTRSFWTAAGAAVVVDDDNGAIVDAVGAEAVASEGVAGATVAGVAVLSPHATADAEMSNAAITRRIELFTLTTIVIG